MHESPSGSFASNRSNRSNQSSQSTAPTTNPVVLFDGVCNLCNGAVTWLLARDTHGVLRFGSLQSEAARQLLVAHGALEDLPDSIVLIDRDGVHVRSDAALRIARELGQPWSTLAMCRLLPRSWRDAVYRFIARHRYAWFGKREQCMLPDPSVAHRFIDAAPAVASRVAS